MPQRAEIRALKKRVEELEKQLEQEKSFFNSILGTIPYPIFCKNTSGEYTWCNQAFCDFLGFDREAIIGKTVTDVAPSNHAEVYHKADLDLMESKGHQVYESKVRHADGTDHDVIFNKSYHASNDGKNAGMVGIIIDITEQKKYESKIEKQNEDFERVNKELSEAKEKAIENDRLKSVFLANMSHEIRTPMNGILGFTELLRDNSLQEDDRVKYLDIIKNRGNMLLKLINDIIDISKIDTSQAVVNLNKASLNEIINEIYKFFFTKKNEEGKQDIRLRVFKELSDGDDIVELDSVKIQQVLTNLLENSLKFTSKGWIEFGYEIIKENIKFFVKDTGKGITADKLDIVFERFRQEDESPTRKFGGAGLGLTISKAYVELMEGEIFVESEVEKGTSFYFTIPYREVSQEKKTTIEAPVEEQKSYNWSDKSVLIVEDDYASYEYLRNILLRTKVKLYWVDNGKKAIEMCLMNPEINLVLMDIQLPDVDGYHATKEIKNITNVPVIAQTAHAFPDDEQKCREAGCDEYVTKPIDKQNLLMLMDKLFTEE